MGEEFLENGSLYYNGQKIYEAENIKVDYDRLNIDKKALTLFNFSKKSCSFKFKIDEKSRREFIKFLSNKQKTIRLFNIYSRTKKHRVKKKLFKRICKLENIL